jgi:hypothetical protein
MDSVFSTDFELRGADLPFFHAGKNLFEQNFLEKNTFLKSFIVEVAFWNLE